MNENELSRIVMSHAYQVHTSLGPGLLESAYKECLYYDLLESGITVRKEVPMPLVYKEVKLDCGYRIDLLVADKLVVEVKSVEALNDIHLAQTLTYMRLGRFKLGMLMNFNVKSLRDGIRRIANGM